MANRGETDVSGRDLDSEFIAEVPLAKTAAAYPCIRYVDAAHLGRGLFSRVGWFPAAPGTAKKNIYVLFVGTAEATFDAVAVWVANLALPEMPKSSDVKFIARSRA